MCVKRKRDCHHSYTTNYKQTVGIFESTLNRIIMWSNWIGTKSLFVKRSKQGNRD